MLKFNIIDNFYMKNHCGNILSNVNNLLKYLEFDCCITCVNLCEIWVENPTAAPPCYEGVPQRCGFYALCGQSHGHGAENKERKHRSIGALCVHW